MESKKSYSLPTKKKTITNQKTNPKGEALNFFLSLQPQVILGGDQLAHFFYLDFFCFVNLVLVNILVLVINVVVFSHCSCLFPDLKFFFFLVFFFKIVKQDFKLIFKVPLFYQLFCSILNKFWATVLLQLSPRVAPFPTSIQGCLKFFLSFI